jgi:hypothetical protein
MVNNNATVGDLQLARCRSVDQMAPGNPAALGELIQRQPGVPTRAGNGMTK